MGIVQSFIDEGFPSKSKFSLDDIPDLSGKVIIVTGANTGIGKETAKALLAHNAKVYIAARSPGKAEQAISDLKDETSKEAIYLKLDLGDLQSIKAATEEFMSKETELHVLFNNAGVMLPPIADVTAQNYDLQFGTNVLGHFYFTKLLMPALVAGAKSSPDGKSRIINTSSFASRFSGGVDFNTLKDSPVRQKTSMSKLYSQSKLGNVLLSNELARRHGSQGIVSISLHPGFLNSDLMRHLSIIEFAMVKLLLYDPPYGALTQLWAGTSQEAAELNGEYLIPWARVGKANPVGEDPVLARELWKWMEEQVKDV